MLSRFSRVQLCDPMDCSPPGFSVHQILQARILEWVSISSSRVSSPAQGSNPRLSYLLHRQAGSWPLVPPGKPTLVLDVSFCSTTVFSNGQYMLNDSEPDCYRHLSGCLGVQASPTSQRKLVADFENRSRNAVHQSFCFSSATWSTKSTEQDKVYLYTHDG